MTPCEGMLQLVGHIVHHFSHWVMKDCGKDCWRMSSKKHSDPQVELCGVSDVFNCRGFLTGDFGIFSSRFSATTFFLFRPFMLSAFLRLLSDIPEERERDRKAELVQ